MRRRYWARCLLCESGRWKERLGRPLTVDVPVPAGLNEYLLLIKTRVWWSPPPYRFLEIRSVQARAEIMKFPACCSPILSPHVVHCCADGPSPSTLPSHTASAPHAQGKQHGQVGVETVAPCQQRAQGPGRRAGAGVGVGCEAESYIQPVARTAAAGARSHSKGRGRSGPNGWVCWAPLTALGTRILAEARRGA